MAKLLKIQPRLRIEISCEDKPAFWPSTIPERRKIQQRLRIEISCEDKPAFWWLPSLFYYPQMPLLCTEVEPL